MTDPYGLFGQHVRLRLADKPPNARYCAGDRFGFLVDLNSPTVVGLHDRDDLAHICACWLNGYRIQPYPYLRVHVFWWGQEECWSWCREVGGDVYDDSSRLPRFASHKKAADAAAEWFAATEAAIIDRSEARIS